MKLLVRVSNGSLVLYLKQFLCVIDFQNVKVINRSETWQKRNVYLSFFI